MIQIGEYKRLMVNRLVDHGAYLVEPDPATNRDIEILLPRRYVEQNVEKGDEIDVFIYTDSEDRPVATTERPLATAGEFAFMRVADVNRVGAFLDWGLPKNLLVPFKEQKAKMFIGGTYLVYVYRDNNTGRLVGSARFERFLDNVFPSYKVGEMVDALVIGRRDGIGFETIVDNKHRGIIYFNEVYRPIEIGQRLTAWVKQVRTKDLKIDLTISIPNTRQRIEHIAQLIMDRLNSGDVHVSDSSSADEIKNAFGCSKKDFKKAVGFLYKSKAIILSENKITKS